MESQFRSNYFLRSRQSIDPPNSPASSDGEQEPEDILADSSFLATVDLAPDMAVPTANDTMNALIAAFQAVSIGNRQPPSFDPATDRVNEFFSKFNAVMNGASDADKTSKLAVSLKSDALSWYVAEVAKPASAHLNFDQWQELITRQFAKSSQSKCNELFANKQREDQKAIAYYHATIRMCSAVDPNMSEEIKIAHLSRGLRPELQSKIKLMKPRTTAEFLSDLQVLTDDEEKTADTNKKLIEVLTTQLAKEQAKVDVAPVLFTQAGHMQERYQASYTPHRFGSRCFNCNAEGHYARSCPKPRANPARSPPGPGDRRTGRQLHQPNMARPYRPFQQTNAFRGQGREGNDRQWNRHGRQPQLARFPERQEDTRLASGNSGQRS